MIARTTASTRFAQAALGQPTAGPVNFAMINPISKSPCSRPSFRMAPT